MANNAKTPLRLTFKVIKHTTDKKKNKQTATLETVCKIRLKEEDSGHTLTLVTADEGLLDEYPVDEEIDVEVTPSPQTRLA